MMKKVIIVLATVLLSSQVFAAATLRIPFILVDDHTGKTAVVKLLNAKLAAQGIATLPEYLVISTGSDARNIVQDAEAQLAKALTALGEDPEMIRLEGGEVPTAADKKTYTTCYTGNPLEVPDLANQLTDSLYSEQMQTHALKYKNQTVSLSDSIDLDDPDTQEFLNGSKLWQNWKGQNEDLLIISSVSDDGDDIQESLIKRCQ